MKNLKMDFKSLLIGVFATALFFTTFGFNPTPAESPTAVGRYQAAASERGFIILDTYSGKYILDSQVNYVGKMTWIKGEFKSSFDTGKDKTDRN